MIWKGDQKSERFEAPREAGFAHAFPSAEKSELDFPNKFHLADIRQSFVIPGIWPIF
jgi:hypothetical protein